MSYSPYEIRRDALARLLSASVMGLIKDPTGANLPDDLWRQMIPKANAILIIVSGGTEIEDTNEHIDTNTDTRTDDVGTQRVRA